MEFLSDSSGLDRSTGVKSTRRNRTELVLHLIWTTWKRMPLLADEALERSVWRTIQAEAERQACTVLAIGGMPDHVHVVLVQPPTIAVSKLMNQLKGVSSSVARDTLGPEKFFRWGDGYAAFSLSRPHCQAAIAYVTRQKEHHATENLWDRWEWAPPSWPEGSSQPQAR